MPTARPKELRASPSLRLPAAMRQDEHSSFARHLRRTVEYGESARYDWGDSTQSDYWSQGNDCMAAETTGFGALLRRLRLAAGLTQESLAERAGVSAKAVSD